MSKKIMIIDDEPDTLSLVRAILKIEGFTVETYESSQKALEIINKGKHPDLILLDMRMPILSGPGFCDELYKNEKNKKIKIVFFTASSDLDKTLAKKHKALGFIFKPFDNENLIKQINKYLKKT